MLPDSAAQARRGGKDTGGMRKSPRIFENTHRPGSIKQSVRRRIVGHQAIWAIVSMRRLENPHSLSYQLTTFSSLP